MNETRLLFVGSYILVNIAAFLLMLIDKNRSRMGGSERISEGMLFFMAAAFGSLGVYAGMFTFRHKTRKWHFIIGIPLLMVQNLSFLYLAYILLNGRL